MSPARNRPPHATQKRRPGRSRPPRPAATRATPPAAPVALPELTALPAPVATATCYGLIGFLHGVQVRVPGGHVQWWHGVQVVIPGLLVTGDQIVLCIAGAWVTHQPTILLLLRSAGLWV